MDCANDVLVQKYEDSKECSVESLIYELSCDDNIKSILLVSILARTADYIIFVGVVETWANRLGYFDAARSRATNVQSERFASLQNSTIFGRGKEILTGHPKNFMLIFFNFVRLRHMNMLMPCANAQTLDVIFGYDFLQMEILHCRVVAPLF